MSHETKGMAQKLYYQFYELARMYWRDMQHSGLDEMGKSKRRAYEVAAQRVGLPLSYSDRLYETCFDERLVPNGRMFEMSEWIEGGWCIRDGHQICCSFDWAAIRERRYNTQRRNAQLSRRRRHRSNKHPPHHNLAQYWRGFSFLPTRTGHPSGGLRPSRMEASWL
jgi:hypothetical protein